MIKTGIDIITSVVDATGQGARSVEASVRGMGERVQRSGDDVGRRYGANLAGAIISGLAAAGLDRALEQIISAQKTGESIGTSLLAGIVAGLRSIPVAGALGELLTRNLDKALGGTGRLPGEDSPELLQGREDTERAQRRQRREQEIKERYEQETKRRAEKERDDQKRDAEQRQREQEDFEQDLERLRRGISDDTLTDEQRKRRDFEEELLKLRLRGLDSEQQERMRKLFDEQLARQRQTKDAEQQRKQEDERARQQDAIRSAEDRLPGATDARGLTGVAEAFRARRGSNADVVTEQRMSNQILRLINDNLKRLSENEPQVANF